MAKEGNDQVKWQKKKKKVGKESVGEELGLVVPGGTISALASLPVFAPESFWLNHREFDHCASQTRVMLDALVILSLFQSGPYPQSWPRITEPDGPEASPGR